jgi:cellulose synthase (UDP-forming)
VEALVIISFWDVPKFDRYERLPQAWEVEIDTGTQVWSGITSHIWEAGAEITLVIPSHQEFPSHLETMKLLFSQQQLAISGWVKKVERLPQPNNHRQARQSSSLTKILRLQIAFDIDNIPQQRKLVENLFCQPGQWRLQFSPGELTMLGLMLKALIYPLKRFISPYTKSKKG